MRSFCVSFTLFCALISPSLASPDTLSGLALWLDADDPATLMTNATGSITNWLDKSGNDRHADNVEGTPDIATNVLNGATVVNFEGSAFLYTTHDFRSLTEYTILTVSHYLPGAKGRVISSRGQNWLFGYHSARDERFYANGWISSTGDANEDWHLHAGTINSDADPKASFYKDGVLLVKDNTGSSNTAYTPAQLSLGAYQNQGNEPSDCEIAEVIIYDRVLSNTELNQVGHYLQLKYGFDFGYNDPNGPLVELEDFGQLAQASNITQNAADISGQLVSTGQAAAVVTTLYGTTDGGTVPSAWDQQQVLPGNPSQGLFNVSLSGLSPGEVIYYRFMAVSAGSTNFSSRGAFHTARDSFPFPVVSNGLTIWLDAESQPYEDGASAPVWMDQTTNGLSGFQSLAAETPTFTTNGINGRAAMRFDGSDIMLMDDFSSAFSDAATVFVVANSAIAANYALFTTQGNAPAMREGSFLRAGTFRSGRINVEGNLGPYEDPTIYEITSGPSNWELFFDGTTAATAAPQFNAGVGFQKAIGGRTQDSNVRLNGDIAEILVYNRVLTETERQDIGSYLADKYGLQTAYANPNFPVVNNDTGADAVTTTSATLRAELETDGLNPPTELTFYWGTIDGGTNGTAWAQSLNVGVQSVGGVSLPVNSLLPDTTYYYRVYSENTDGEYWAESSARFHTDLVPADFAKQLDIQFCGYAGSETLTNFTALVVFSNHISGLEFNDFAADGGDLRFTDANGTRVLFHEIESWNTNGASHVWVQIPLLTASTTIRAYYGNGSAALPAYATDGRAWDAVYAGVWHMNEANAEDATFPANDGVSVGTVSTTTGVVHHAQSMDNSYINIINGEHDFDFVGDQITASAWVRVDGGWRENWQAFVSKRGEGGQGWQIRRFNNTDELTYTLRGTTGVDDLGGVSHIVDGNWHYVVGVYGQNRRTLFVDGVAIQDDFDSGYIIPTTLNDTVKIGADDGGASRHRGLIDEVRVSETFRSADWVVAEYQNMAANTNFLCFGVVASTAAPEISNAGGVANLQPTSVSLQGELITDGGAAATVRFYWGTNDGGASFAWDNVVDIGVQAVGPVSTSLTGLAPDTDYFYRAYATNVNGAAFAFDSVAFRSAGPPLVSNGPGATEIRELSATLNGSFLNLNRGDVTIYYGLSDGGEVSGNWSHAVNLGQVDSETFSVSVNDTLFGQPYFYRVFASNAQGSDWSDIAVMFSSDPLRMLAGEGLLRYEYDTANLATDLTPISLLAAKTADVEDLELGVISYLNDFVSLLPGITDPNNFSLRYDGYFVPDTEGFYTFGLFSDDASVLYLDLNGDQQFDDGTAIDPGELIINRPCCGSTIGMVYLEARPYRIAIGMQQGGGGRRLEVRWLSGQETDYNALAPLDTRSGHFFTSRERVNTLANTTAQDIEATTATLHADLHADGAIYEVFAYWGSSDAGTMATNWDNAASVGVVSNGIFDLAFPVTGLSGDTSYFYTYRATNAVDVFWAPMASSFRTIAPPTIENGPSAPIVNGDGVLIDTVLTGGAANVRVYYGTSDGNADTNAWDSSYDAGELLEGAFQINFPEGLYGLNYFYRLYAENAQGTAWASASVPFTRLPPVTPSPPGLELRQWNFVSGSGNFNPISALQARTDYDGVEIETGPVNYQSNFDSEMAFIDDNNTFTLLWQGVMIPPFGAGDYSFGLRHDDQSIIVLDLDGDGDFDDGSAFDPGELVVDGGLFSGTGCCGNQFGTVALEDRPYRIAIALTQGGGGNYIDAKWTGGVNTNNLSTMSFIDGGSGVFVQDLDQPATYIRALAPTNLTLSSAELMGVLSATGSVFNLILYHGDNDGGTNAGNWDVTVPLGSFTDVVEQVSFAATGIDTTVTNFYTFRIDNALETTWATNTVSFMLNTGLDSDSDGMTDVDENIAGTNPNDPNSFLGLNIARGGATNQRDLSFESVSGRTYRIERNDDLLGGSWVTVQSGLVGNDGVLNLMDTQATPYSVYRIVVE